MSDPLLFSFYGADVHLRTTSSEIRARVRNDFSYFQSGHEASANPQPLQIEARLQPPHYDGLPELTASVNTPRNICYSDGDITYIDYFERALSTYDRSRNTLRIDSADSHLLHEIIFLSILSRVCERLERQRLHRVHALGVQAGAEAALFMMPSGCGKTTLALSLLQQRIPYRLISEDSPLIDVHGNVLPFPLRIGVLGDLPEGIDEEHVTFVKRMEFEPKHLISLDAFGEVLAEGPSVPRYVFLGERSLATTCRIEEIGRLTAFQGFVRHMIVGVGLYQGVEFLLRSSPLDLFKMTGLLASRTRRAASVIRKARTYRLILGRDRDQNLEAIVTFLKKERFGGGDPSETSTPNGSSRPAATEPSFSDPS